MDQPNPDGASQARRRLAFDPFGIDQRDERIDGDTAMLGRGTQAFPEKGFKADRGLMAIDRDRVFDRRVVGYLHTVSTYADHR